MLLRSVRLLPAGPARASAAASTEGQVGAPMDVRAQDGIITAIAPHLPARAGEEVHEADGAIAVPGLWDQHVHVGQTAQGYSRLDTSAAAGTEDLLRLVADALADSNADGPALVGFGHRLVDLRGTPSVAALDAVAPRTPVVLIGGDAHHAWMNTAALRGLGLPPHAGVVGEDEWFTALAHLDDLPGVAAGLEAGVRQLQDDALARGIVGLVDMEWAVNWRLWQRRAARLRVRTATYLPDLDDVPGPSGTPVTEGGLVRMGPLKIILDGALGSRSALCRHAYGALGGQGRGVLSLPTGQLQEALRRGRQRGLDAAVHAIGDAAVGLALEAFARDAAERNAAERMAAGRDATGRESTGRNAGAAVGAHPRARRIEHAQMLTDADVAAMARLGVTASVQPAHLLDDRDPTEELWAGHADQAYRFADLQRAGVPLVLGSDSPVAPVDPWLAMAAAVHRSADSRPAWFPAQQLQPLEALVASTDGIREIVVGGPADLVLLAEDPFAPVPRERGGLMVESAAREAGARLRAVRPLATVVAGSLAFSR